MMERLSFSNDVGAKYASMLAFPCTAQQFSSGHLDTVMSVTTRLLPWEVTTATGGDHRSFPGGQEVFKEYQAKLNLRSVHFGEDMKAAENQDFISQGSTNNATCFIGPHRQYDPFTRSFLNLVPGQGHFGPDAIPGVRTRMLQTSSSCARAHARHTRSPLRLSGCALAPRGERVAQDGPRYNGAFGVGPALPDGLLGALSTAHQANAGMPVQESRHPSRRRRCVRDQRSVWVLCVCVCVCVVGGGWCFCACVRSWEMGFNKEFNSLIPHTTCTRGISLARPCILDDCACLSC